MKKVALAVLLVLLVLGVSVIGYRFYQAKQQEARYRALEVEMVRAEFGAYVARMQEAVGQQGRDELKALAEKFPVRDAGIGYESRFAAREEAERTIFTPRVQYIYRGSAAEKAGILPGDLITAIGDTSVEIVCDKGAENCPSPESVANVQAAIDEADKKPSSFLYERKGATQWPRAALTPIAYGQDIHDYLVAHQDGYIKQFDVVAPKVDALAEKVKKLDEKNIESLSTEARALAKEVEAPFRDFEAYLETRVILPPRGTQAVPQL